MSVAALRGEHGGGDLSPERLGVGEAPPNPARGRGKVSEWLEIDGPRMGKKIRYRVDIDAREFRGRAGMPWLIMAANVNLSITELLDVMAAYGYERTRSWVSRRRWIFFAADYVRYAGRSRNADGQEDRARRIMDQHPRVSARELARMLAELGIKRGKDWVLKNRVTGD